LDAAEFEFGEHGYHATAVGSITSRAGVAQGTFYLYFPHKEAALRELVEAMGWGLRRTLASATAGAVDRLDAERLGLEAFVRTCLEHRHLYRVVMESQFVAPEVHHAYYQRLADAYAAALATAVERGEIRAVDPTATAWALMGIAHFVGLRFATWEARMPSEGELAATIDVVRAALERR
jgi:AcrR family transcriptional regulator